MQDILTNLAANLIWFLIGGGAISAYRFFFQVLPTKRLWQLRDPSKAVICISTSSVVDTGKYNRPTVGIGQVRGLTIISSSLSRSYNIQVKNILLSEDQVLDRIENDVILVGGPEHNRLTRRFLDRLSGSGLAIADQVDNVIYWKKTPEEEVFTPVTIDQRVERDYGLIIRMANPFASSDTTVCLFSGTHTYGTIAAARFFTETLQREQIGIKPPRRNLAIVISCDVVDGWPVNLQEERRCVF